MEGKWEGPYVTAEQVCSALECKAFLAVPTFPVSKGDKVRAVCDYSASGHNAGVAIATPERLDALDDCFEAAATWKRTLLSIGWSDPEVCLGKIDLKAAYEQIPARASDRWANVVQVRRTPDAERLFPHCDWARAGTKVWLVSKRQTVGKTV